MIRDELEHVLEDLGEDFRIHWLESGLHNFPNLLRERLQETLDSLSGCDPVLMAFGRCGNVFDDLHTGAYELILPNTDDCISLLLGSTRRRLDYSRDGGMYFLTRGWLRGGRNIWTEYVYAREKYGEQCARAVMEALFRNYRHLSVVDTRSYDLDGVLPMTETIAGTFNLTHRVIPGTLQYLRDLLTGPWDDGRFILCPPHSRIGASCRDAQSPAERVDKPRPEELW
jgi:hypothetical protein